MGISREGGTVHERALGHRGGGGRAGAERRVPSEARTEAVSVSGITGQSGRRARGNRGEREGDADRRTVERACKEVTGGGGACQSRDGGRTVGGRVGIIQRAQRPCVRGGGSAAAWQEPRQGIVRRLCPAKEGAAASGCLLVDPDAAVSTPFGGCGGGGKGQPPPPGAGSTMVIRPLRWRRRPQPDPRSRGHRSTRRKTIRG